MHFLGCVVENCREWLIHEQRNYKWTRVESYAKSKRLILSIIKYKITPYASATAIGGTIDYVSMEYSVSNCIGGVTGVILYFFNR